MKRNIIEINQELCNGCGLCVDACHEGALAMVDGKATLISDSYCDGLGHCLPECPTGAITVIEREAEDYNEELVQQRMAQRQQGAGCPSAAPQTLACGCPSSNAKELKPQEASFAATPMAGFQPGPQAASELRSWPIQIKLVPVNAPYLDGAHLLIAADCTAFAYANFHQEFMRGKITLIGCPKLDEGDYAQKLTEIIRENDIKSVTILRMEVPCCAGMVNAAKTALQNSGKMIPWGYHIISTGGMVLE